MPVFSQVPLAEQQFYGGTSGGTATAQTITCTPGPGAYAAGQKYRYKVGSGLGSTGSTATAHTLNVNGLGAKNLVNNEDATNPTLGTWIAGATVEVMYDGANFVILNDPGGLLSWTPTVTGTASMTISALTVNEARYRKFGKTITIWIDITFTTGGTASTGVLFTVPVNKSGHASTALVPVFLTDTTSFLGYSTLTGTTTCTNAKLDGSNWGLGASRYVRGSFSYVSV